MLLICALGLAGCDDLGPPPSATDLAFGSDVAPFDVGTSQDAESDPGLRDVGLDDLAESGSLSLPADPFASAAVEPAPAATLAVVAASAPEPIREPAATDDRVEAEPLMATEAVAPRVYQMQPIRGARLVSQTMHDWGTATVGTEIRHTFVLKNTGDRPLSIQRVTPTLGCVSVRFDREIEAGSVGRLEVVMRTDRLNIGRARVTVALETSDRRADTTLILSGRLDMPHSGQRAMPAALPSLGWSRNAMR